MRDSGQMSRIDAACIDTPDRVYLTAVVPVCELSTCHDRSREVDICVLQKEEDSVNLLSFCRAGGRKLLGDVAAGLVGKSNAVEAVVGGGGLVGNFPKQLSFVSL